jgi:hypothetical protein
VVTVSAESPPPPIASPGVAATVNVTAAAGVISTDSSEIVESNATTRSIQNLPVSANFSSLLFLSPRPGLTGARTSENSFVIDGTTVSPSEGELDGKTILVVRPDRPARAPRAIGDVAVDVDIDVFGNVRRATAVSGNVLLRKAAEKAALLTRFAPVNVDGKAVRLTGTIVYGFKKTGKVNVGLSSMKAFAPNAADRRLVAIAEKMHFWLGALVERLGKPGVAAGPNEAKFVHKGRAEIEIDLSARSPIAIAKLKAAGFELVAEKGRTRVTGRIALERLAGLVDIEEVKLILPRI